MNLSQLLYTSKPSNFLNLLKKIVKKSSTLHIFIYTKGKRKYSPCKQAQENLTYTRNSEEYSSKYNIKKSR